MNSFHDRYRRLARARFGLSSLWLAEDHLVYVKGSGFLMPFVEEYKRFRLSEIEAISVAKTSRLGIGLLYLFTLMGSVGAFALILALVETMRPITVVFLSLFLASGLASLALLLRHLVLGPTCVCDLQTRLTRERIRPLNRYHRTLETVRRIEGLVRESQVGIVPTEAEAGAEGYVRAARPEAIRGDGFFEVPGPVPLTFGFFLGLGLAALAALHLESAVLTGGVLLLLVGASLLVVLALVSVVRKPTPDSIRNVLWVLLGLHFLVIGIGTVYFLVAATREPAYTVGITGPIEAFTAVASEGGLVLYGVFAGLFLGFLVSGLAGLLLCGKWRRQIRHAASLVAAPTPGVKPVESETP